MPILLKAIIEHPQFSNYPSATLPLNSPAPLPLLPRAGLPRQLSAQPAPAQTACRRELVFSFRSLPCALSTVPHRCNPVLREVFRCRYDHPSDKQGFAEQGKPAPCHFWLPSLISSFPSFCPYHTTYTHLVLRFSREQGPYRRRVLAQI